jgi:L-ascorbate metabolism protein UlaG (beta-lactamase superfamily)
MKQRIPTIDKFINESEKPDDRVTLDVTISNLDKSTADDFLKMFKFMEWCGNVGTGRGFKAYFDGDGHFRPKIKIDGIDMKDIDIDEEDLEGTDDGLELGFGA